jgi:formylglycine-generating enzyme required for sulfatase activity
MKIIPAWIAFFCLPLGVFAAEPAHDLALDLGQGHSLKLVLIPAGKFIMGSPPSEPYRRPDEGPQHEVTISKPFYMGIYTVTQEQFMAVMPEAKPRLFVGPTLPWQPSSFEEITTFCQKLSEKTGQKVRLPTEAEWEYACRAGTTTPWFFGSDLNQGQDYGWYQQKFVHPVGLKKPNPWGLYDMYGNVAQVVSDWGAEVHQPSAPYPSGPVTDPTGVPGPTDSRSQHIARGSPSWLGNSRSAFRGAYGPPGGGDKNYGFRIVVEVPKPAAQ